MNAKARILAAADGSRSVQELAALAGCTASHVYQVVQGAGLPVRPTSVKARVIALADGRRTAPDIARLIGADPGYVRAAANDLGLPVPPVRTRCDIDGLLRWAAKANRSIRAIATRSGVSYMTAYRRLRALGLPFQPGRRGRPRKETVNG